MGAPDADSDHVQVDSTTDHPTRSKQHKPSPSTKSKDLSHVPCKFYRVGSCTAGLSCPFSHSSSSRSAAGSSTDPNNPNPNPKDVCAWFVKGTCKFGHKCALAHVLPGQSMAMDRKNKKAAQIAAAGQQGQTRGGKGNKQRDHAHAAGKEGGGTAPTASGGGTLTLATTPRSNPLLSGGSTAPTRSVHPLRSRSPSQSTTNAPPPTRSLPMPSLKATISPSAPAPPLKDTDFPSFSIPDDPPPATEPDPQATDNPLPTSPLQLSSRPPATHTPKNPSHDFGPIGSPPRSSPHTRPSAPLTLNGFSPSPPTDYPFGATAAPGGSSPFSAPTISSTINYVPSSPSPTQTQQFRSGLAASLGTAHLTSMMAGRPSSVTNANPAWFSQTQEKDKETALEDEDLEEFIPGSLSDLLTPNERSRRMSRTHSQHPPTQPQQHSARPILSGHSNNFSSGMGLGIDRTGGGASRHHYSRSVPAPSLLGDLKSIWASNDLHPNPNSNLGVGTPSSFKSTSNFGGRTSLAPGTDGAGLGIGGTGTSGASYTDPTALSSSSPSMSISSMLSPTNASAAFLGGLHHHYLNRGAGVQRSVSGERGGLSAHSGFAANGGLNANANGSGNGAGNGYGYGMAFSPPRLNTFGSRPPFSTSTGTHDTPTHPSQTHTHSHLSQELSLNGSNPAPTTTSTPNPPTTTYLPPTSNPQASLSPSTRALQSHAPGQSLPQGLAAGYSRIHALPPPPNMGPSPAFSGVGSPGSPGTGGLEWLGLAPPGTAAPDVGNGAGTGTGSGLESMFSRLSYSAAASRPSQPSALSLTSSSGPQANPTVARTPSGGKPWQSGSAGAGGGALSPLSGPVLTGDDDDLFSMDG